MYDVRSNVYEGLPISYFQSVQGLPIGAHVDHQHGLVTGFAIDKGKEGVDAQIKALSMYRGVMRPYPHPRSAEYITGLAAVRGSQWGVNYAESFEVVLRSY